MAKGYAVVTYRKINNQDKWAAYAKIASVIVPKLGGRFIIRGMPAAVHEMGIKDCYSSPEYKEALKALGDGAQRDFRFVEGVA